MFLLVHTLRERVEGEDKTSYGVNKVELWKLRMPSIDRHVNEVELWKYVFDKLLHFDPVQDDYDSVVGGIRNKFDAYVRKNQVRLKLGLKRSTVPSPRSE